MNFLRSHSLSVAEVWFSPKSVWFWILGSFNPNDLLLPQWLCWLSAKSDPTDSRDQTPSYMCQLGTVLRAWVCGGDEWGSGWELTLESACSHTPERNTGESWKPAWWSESLPGVYPEGQTQGGQVPPRPTVQPVVSFLHSFHSENQVRHLPHVCR